MNNLSLFVSNLRMTLTCFLSDPLAQLSLKLVLCLYHFYNSMNSILLLLAEDNIGQNQ